LQLLLNQPRKPEEVVVPRKRPLQLKKLLLLRRKPLPKNQLPLNKKNVDK
jgi:hypothetical protein